jgi:hypothetical protein
MGVGRSVDLIQRTQARSREWFPARTNRNKEQGNLNNNGNLQASECTKRHWWMEFHEVTASNVIVRSNLA